MAGKSHIWYNTLWDTHAGGHDDDCSLLNKDKGYGYLINNLGATILQTDRPAYLIDYLKHKSKVMDCNRDWTYLQSENEFQAPSVPHLSLIHIFPGIGTIHGAFWSNQPSATCVEVMPRVRPKACSTFTMRVFARIASAWKRGRVCRLSLFGSKTVYSLMQPPKNPRFSGLYGTKPIPSSRCV